MGKFIQETEKKFIENQINNYLDATNSYSKQFNGSPIFCTYYQMDLNSSTRDVTLNTPVSIVGTDSPLRYNKIENFPLYLEGDMNFQQVLEEDSGFSQDFEGTATLLPNTIIPQSDDLLFFNILEHKFLFRISNVETSNTTMRTFYRITFIIASLNIDILEENQIKESYNTIYRNIGTELAPIIPMKEFTMLDDIQGIIDKFSEKYTKYFYDSKTNCFIYNREKIHSLTHCFYKDNNIYDPKLAIFIKRNNLFIKEKTFLKNIFVDNILEGREYDYDKCIYSLLETLDLEEYEYEAYYFNTIEESLFKLLPDKYHELIHNKDIIYHCKCGHCKDLMDSGVFTKSSIQKYINDWNLSIDHLDYKEQILIIYLRIFNKNKQNNISDYYEDILSLAKQVKIEKDIFTYVLIPCIIFILKRVQERIMLKNDKII